MGKRDKRIDAYLKKAKPFAKPILTKLRELIHKGIPEVEESVKWGMPFFDYKGPVCNLAGFKEHAVMGFWKAELLNDPKGYLQARSSKGGEAMGNLGRLTSIKDLPPDNVILDFIKQAKKFNDDGIKLPPKKKQQTELVIPEVITNALKKNKKAKDTFENFSNSHKKEYTEWITEAKTDATREKRLATMLEWLEEGKSRNWKYMKK